MSTPIRAMPEPAPPGLDTWLADLRDLDEVDRALARIAERAVLELGVAAAVAVARPAPGVDPRGRRHSAPTAATLELGAPLRPGAADEVRSAAPLQVRAWSAHRPGDPLPHVLLLDLGHVSPTREPRHAAAPGPPARGADVPRPGCSQRRPEVEVEAGAAGAWLELHGTRPLPADPEALLAATLLAARASLLLAGVERVFHLRRALETRSAVSRAQGVLMERYGLPAPRAMALLRRTSQRSGRRIRDLADELVGTFTSS